MSPCAFQRILSHYLSSADKRTDGIVLGAFFLGGYSVLEIGSISVPLILNHLKTKLTIVNWNLYFFLPFSVRNIYLLDAHAHILIHYISLCMLSHLPSAHSGSLPFECL